MAHALIARAGAIASPAESTLVHARGTGTDDVAGFQRQDSLWFHCGTTELPRITLTLKGVPERVHRGLKKRAEAQRRSLNREIILCLDRSVEVEAFDPEEWLAKADRMREKLGLRGLTDAGIRAEKRRRRP